MLEFFSDSSDSDVEGCQGICFIVCADVFIAPAKFPSSFLLNLINETLVKEMLR